MRAAVLLALPTLLVGLLPAFAEEGYAPPIKIQSVLRTTTDGAGEPLRYPRTGEAEITGVIVEIPAGKSTGWHVHPVPCVAHVLEGEVEVEFEGAPKKTFKAGDTFAEVVNRLHCGFNRTTRPVRILMFAIGERGVPISRRSEAK